jgi:cytoskeleton protein RodZ
MSSSPFGEHLKRERELRGVSLDEIAAATRIKTTFLEALENGRWDELPGGAFNRGFVRATAHFLGLDEEGMVAEYALETGGELQVKTPPQTSGAMPRDYRPALVALASLLLLLIGGAWFVHHGISARLQKRAEAETSPGTAISTDGAPGGSVSTATAGPVTAPAEAPANPSITTAAKPIASNSAPGSGLNHPPPASAPPANVPPSQAAPVILKLRLETAKTSHIVVVGDGKILFKGRLHGDDPKNFQARDGFQITSSEAGVVKLQLNGQNIPFTAGAGRHGGTIAISRKNLKGSEPSR